ncbi:MAG: S-adenosylmethionine:tRNA ribosyltransferase-isomerase [Acidobacteriota bacterium]|jgi:S-adenosylmethionine:tRNA ribosyltransferase-isomerase|nr:S-adenosylmethionine:tRNA ribosyltransferase-isomerase [Acidobacteriota bacterium]
MFIADFDYELPEELIAQHPLEERDAARMLVLDRAERAWRESRFAELPSYVRAGDVVVINNTRVFPARLVGRREPSGGRVELFLVREREPLVWETLARPARRLQLAARVSFGDGRLRAEVVELLEDGRRAVRFECDTSFEDAIEELGQTPLPPYIKRTSESLDEDRERYQTVYARERGAIAAPTAGLHFTPRVITELKARGAHLAEITLHVGYGTFEPVRAEDLSEHSVAPEQYEISEATAEAINEARSQGRRIIAIGTTTTRALESAVDEEGRVRAGTRMAQLTITPGYRFRVVDALLTNFHLPRSSLLVLIAAFAGRELALAAYAHAVQARYRFYSYGDCMLII